MRASLSVVWIDRLHSLRVVQLDRPLSLSVRTIGWTPQPEYSSTIRQTPQPSSSIGKVNNNYTCNSAWCVFSSDISHVIVLISIENL